MAEQPKRPKAPRPNIGAGSLRVGRLTKPHGLKGGLKVELYTDNPELRFESGSRFHLQVPQDSSWFERTIHVRELRWFNGAPVAFFDEIVDRITAESIVRAILWIDEESVAESVEDNAWYHHQLVGLEVRRDGRLLGTVEEVQHLPAQDLLVVATESGTVLVPFVEAIVPHVDLDTGVVTVTPPAGLFEELPEVDASDLDQTDSNSDSKSDSNEEEQG